MWDDISDSTPATELWVPSTFFQYATPPRDSSVPRLLTVLGSRLSKFFAYRDPFNERYNLGDVPADCQWGAGPLSSRLSRNERVVHMWAIGHLQSFWFFTTLDDQRPAARICLELVRENDTQATRRLMSLANHSQAAGTSHKMTSPSQLMFHTTGHSWTTRVDFCADRMDSKERKVSHLNPRMYVSSPLPSQTGFPGNLRCSYSLHSETGDAASIPHGPVHR